MSRLAIAAGGWGASARLKLDAVGGAGTSVPLASADDGRSREHIVRTAAARAVRDVTLPLRPERRAPKRRPRAASAGAQEFAEHKTVQAPILHDGGERATATLSGRDESWGQH